MQKIIEVVTTTGRVVQQSEGDGREFLTLFHSGDPWVYLGTRYYILENRLDWFGPMPRMRVVVKELYNLGDNPQTIFPPSN